VQGHLCSQAPGAHELHVALINAHREQQSTGTDNFFPSLPPPPPPPLTMSPPCPQGAV
jgi:hypothetical protein